MLFFNPCLVHSKWLVPGGIFLVCVFPYAAFTQTVFDLEPFPVTDGPVISQIEISSRADTITRVGEDQIHKLGAGDLSAALRRVPGVTLSRYNVVGAFGGGDGGAIFIRGQGSGRPGAEIVTLTDGVARFVGVWTHPLLDTLPTDFAAAIEVFKSPQPVRFGNMAFGAVNLIPQRAKGVGWSGSARAEYGTWDTISLFGDIGYASPSLNLYAGYSHRQSDGHRTNADGRVDAFQARGEWINDGGWEFSLMTQVMDSRASDPEPVGMSLPIVQQFEVENQFYLGQIRRTMDEWSLSAKFYAEVGELDWRQWHQPPPPPFPAQAYNTITHYGNHGMKTQLRYEGDPVTVAGGFAFDSYGGRVLEDYTMAPDNRFGEERFHLAAPFLHLEWNLLVEDEAPRLVLSAGSRAFMHDEFDDKVAYQTGVRYHLGRSTLYANAARSYNYPGVFVSVFGRRPPPWSVGEDWRELDPESIDHLEVGLSHAFSPSLILTAAVFHDKVKEALRIAPPPPAGRILNLGDYTVKGAEFSLRASPQDNLDFFVALTYLDADAGVPNAPEWTFTLGTEWEPFKGWFLSGDLQHLDQQRVINTRFDTPRGTIDAYTLVNLRISHILTTGSATTEIYLRADNVFGESYEHRPGYPMPGASLTAGIRTQF